MKLYEVLQPLMEQSPLKLRDVCEIRTEFEDADFWVVRKGTLESVGHPVKEYSPEHIGIKVINTDILFPDYLYYMLQYLHSIGKFKQIARGTLSLVNIRVSDVKNIELDSSLNEAIQLNEAKFAKQKIYGFHGTHSGNLRSIIKQGLVAQHQKGWGSGFKSTYGYDMTPVGGVYFSLYYQRAYGIAIDVTHDIRRSRNKDLKLKRFLDETDEHLHPVIIIAEIQPRSIMIDEDRLEDLLNLPPAHLLGKIIKDVDDIEEEMEESLLYTKNRLKSETNIPSETIDKTVEALKPYYLALVEELLDLQAETSVDEEPDSERVQLHNKNIKDLQNKIRKIFKYYWRYMMFHDLTEEDGLFAVDGPVTFSGTNKIVGIIVPKKKIYWGYMPTGNVAHDDFKHGGKFPNIHKYIEVKTPMELFNNSIKWNIE